MSEKRFELLDETIFDNQKQAEDGGRVTYWVVEYQQRQELVELLNSLSEEKEKAELKRENEILQRKLNSFGEDSVNELFFGYDIGEYENMNYAIYDTSKCEKKKEDFWDNEEECYDMMAYTGYLEENDCVLSCDEVVDLLNKKDRKIRQLEWSIERREEQISIIKKHCLKFLTDEQFETIRKALEDE